MAMINAWSSGTKPWSFPDVYDEVQAVASLRMQLLPYIYTTFAQYRFEGIPPVRPMVLVEDFQPELIQTNSGEARNLLYDIKDQYMFGDNLLVAPMFTGESVRDVILPDGKWYDFYTGEYAGSNEIIEVEPGLGQIPLFVKNGGIIPMIEHRLHAPQPATMIKLIARHYGDIQSEYLMYDDDGVSFNFEMGEYSWTNLMARKNRRGSFYGDLDRLEGNIFHYLPPEWIFMTATE
jgi:alpha-D-xyloside xylohydrolase